jgi:hypothetical protein
VSSTGTSIRIGFYETSNNGGSKIIEYKLFRDEGDLSSEITTEVTDYNGADSEFTVTGLTEGAVYRFTYFAVN